MSIRLIDVYESIMQDPVEETGVSRTHMVLYELLLERTPETNISHKGMPSLEGREVGIFIFKMWQRKGIGKAAIEELLQRHPGNLLANINPNNERSIQFFEELGAKHIQNTYEICGGD